MNKLTNRFKWARTHIVNESVKRVAEVTGITRSLIDDLETDVKNKKRGVSYITVMKLAEHYGVSMDWLCGYLPFEKWSIKKDARIATEYTGLNSNTITTLNTIHEATNEKNVLEWNTFFFAMCRMHIIILFQMKMLVIF